MKTLSYPPLATIEAALSRHDVAYAAKQLMRFSQVALTHGPTAPPVFACCKPSIPLYIPKPKLHNTFNRCDILTPNSRSYSQLDGFLLKVEGFLSRRCSQPPPIHLRSVAYNKEAIWR